MRGGHGCGVERGFEPRARERPASAREPHSEGLSRIGKLSGGLFSRRLKGHPEKRQSGLRGPKTVMELPLSWACKHALPGSGQGFAWQAARGVRFVEEHRNQYRAERLCKVIEVSERGLRTFRSRPASRRQRTDMAVLAHITAQSLR